MKRREMPFRPWRRQQTEPKGRPPSRRTRIWSDWMQTQRTLSNKTTSATRRARTKQCRSHPSKSQTPPALRKRRRASSSSRQTSRRAIVNPSRQRWKQGSKGPRRQSTRSFASRGRPLCLGSSCSSLKASLRAAGRGTDSRCLILSVSGSKRKLERPH
jgi:hypothetical protein